MGRCIQTRDCSGEQTCSVPIDMTVGIVQDSNMPPIRVCMEESEVPDVEHFVKCEVDEGGIPTGVQVIVSVLYDDNGLPTIHNYHNAVTGEEWEGNPEDLRDCDDGTDIQLEQQAMCDEGTDFIRWYVLENGQPNGNYYDTDLTGASYTPTGIVSIGTCSSIIPPVYTPFGDTITGNTPTNPPATVQSLVITALVGSVIVNIGAGTITIPEGVAYVFGNGESAELDASTITMTGSSVSSVYTIHGEL